MIINEFLLTHMICDKKIDQKVIDHKLAMYIFSINIIWNTLPCELHESTRICKY